jgi:hypothetical protein
MDEARMKEIRQKLRQAGITDTIEVEELVNEENQIKRRMDAFDKELLELLRIHGIHEMTMIPNNIMQNYLSRSMYNFVANCSEVVEVMEEELKNLCKKSIDEFQESIRRCKNGDTDKNN